LAAAIRFGYGKHEKDLPADIRNAGGANLVSELLSISTYHLLPFKHLGQRHASNNIPGLLDLPTLHQT
jgi:hypothetical protein